MDSGLSYMQLLAAVGETAPIHDGRIPSSHSPERQGSPRFERTVELGSSSRAPTSFFAPSAESSDNDLSGESDGKECEYEWSDTEEDDGGGLSPADDLLPNDDEVLFDYEFPIPDSERGEVEIPKVQSVQVDPQGDQHPWKKRKRHTKGVFLPHSLIGVAFPVTYTKTFFPRVEVEEVMCFSH